MTRLPLTSRSRSGKSRLIAATSSALMTCASWPPPRGAERVEAFGLDRAGELGSAGRDDAAVDEHVHDVGDEVVEDALVVRDQQDAELGAVLADLFDAGRDLAQRVDVEAGVGLVEHRDRRVRAAPSAGSRCASSRRRRSPR